MAVKPLATGRSATSPTGTNTQGCVIDVPNVDAIPIIFIPGIMGSNVRNSETKDAVWKLGNGLGLAKTLVSQGTKKPETLQRELDENKTEVDPTGDILVDASRLGLTKQELRDRGWGSVHWDSYGGILTYLEKTLNHAGLEIPTILGIVPNANPDKTQPVLDWKKVLQIQNLKPHFNPLMPLKGIQESEINHLKGFDFPVYALGYNWLQSNEISAQKLAKRLDQIKAELCVRFHKFIIVSHSMGGLVTRRLAQLRQADIAGVVHGVMPSDGAAATYRRLVSGSLENLDIKGYAAAKVLGETTQHMTAALANSCGGLELLPTVDYNNGEPWLVLNGKNEAGQNVTVKLPQKDATGKIDPYSQIYKSDKVWWQMVKAEFLNPANIKGVTKDTYYEKINDVARFHKKILKSYHPCTYVYYGSDDHNSFGVLQWTLDKPIKGLNAQQLQRLPEANNTENILKKAQSDEDQRVFEQKQKRLKNPAEGRTSSIGSRTKYTAETLPRSGVRYLALTDGNIVTCHISGHDSSGDGTVPVSSANTPLHKAGVQQVCAMKGFDHQGSYEDKNARAFVLYAITRIVKDNNIQPKYT